MFSPNLPHLLGACTSLVTMFLHPIKSVTHIPQHKIYHLRHGLHLELKFYLGRGWYVVLIWHDSSYKHWLVVKKKSSRRSCFAQTLLISSHAHTSRLTFAELKPTPNITNLAVQFKYVNMTQEAIKTREQAKQNWNNSLARKWIYPKYERN
jgi:hypothetical protein